MIKTVVKLEFLKVKLNRYVNRPTDFCFNKDLFFAHILYTFTYIFGFVVV